MNNYAKDEQFSQLVEFFSNCALVACSNEALLLRTESTNTRNVLNNLENHALLNRFSQTVFGKIYHFKVLTSDELSVLKLNYYRKS